MVTAGLVPGSLVPYQLPGSMTWFSQGVARLLLLHCAAR